MKSPVADAEWLILDSTTSTQDVAAKQLLAGARIGAVLAQEQVGGRGRFRREWHSPAGDSLSVSFIFRDYADWPKPHLVGMAMAVAAAIALDCRVQWPNDLVLDRRKLGGILTEMVADTSGRMVPIVGIGVNLNQNAFPMEIADVATSLAIARGGLLEAVGVARQIVERLGELPEPNDWSNIEPVWRELDATSGKQYRLGDGRVVVAESIGAEGELIGLADGEHVTVLAADALFGGQI